MTGYLLEKRNRNLVKSAVKRLCPNISTLLWKDSAGNIHRVRSKKWRMHYLNQQKEVVGQYIPMAMASLLSTYKMLSNR